MLSIDEAISHARDVSKRNMEQWKNCPADRRDIEHQTCEQCAKEREQLSEWLEELKALKIGLNIKCDSLNEALEKGKKVGYSNALDDCLKIVEWDGYTLDIKHRIEKLKEGVENE